MIHNLNMDKKIYIYEMLLRDGLQSFKKIQLQTKIDCFNELIKNNYYCIEFGSITNLKIVPQMENTIDLWNYITSNNYYTKFMLLVTSNKYINHNLFNYNIKSYSFVCTLDDIFAKNNLNKTSIETINDVKYSINNIIKNVIDPHIRVYISYAFYTNTDDDKLLNNLHSIVQQFINISNNNNLSFNNFDIVLCDTIGILTSSLLYKTLSLFTENEINFIGLHLHSDLNFYELINISLKFNIKKFDSSICGIGGCPFSSKIIGNISTYHLVKYLHEKNYITGLDENILKNTDNKIKSILNII